MRLRDFSRNHLLACLGAVATLACARPRPDESPSSSLSTAEELDLYEVVLRASEADQDAGPALRINTEIDHGPLARLASAGRLNSPVVGRLQVLPDSWTSRLLRQGVIRGTCRDDCHGIANALTLTPPRADPDGRIVVVVSSSGNGLYAFFAAKHDRRWRIESKERLAVY